MSRVENGSFGSNLDPKEAIIHNGERKIILPRDGEFGIEEIRLGYGISPGFEVMTGEWNNVAPDYVDGFRERKDSRYELVEIPELLRRVRHKLKGGKVLDVGSGPLIFAERNVFNNHPEDEWPEEYWALDPSEVMWEIADKRVCAKLWENRLIKIQNGIEEAGLPENYFDLVFANFSLENSSDPIEGIKRIYSSLKHGGVFAGVLKHQERNQKYLQTFGQIDFKLLLKAMSADSLWAKEYWEGCGERGTVWALYTLTKTWRNWFEEAGFSTVTLVPPEIKPEVWENHSELAQRWNEQGHSGLIFVAKKNNNG